MAKITAEMLDTMVEQGLTALQIAAIVKSSMTAQTGAQRQAKYLAAKRAKEEAERLALVTKNDENDVTSVTSVTASSSLSPVPLLSPIPPNNPLTPKPSSKNNRGHRLPADATITGPDLAYALSKGLLETEAAGLWERMASWAWSASGANSRKINWHQAYQGWVQREGPKLVASRARVSGRPLTAYQQSKQETRDILNDLDNFARGGSGGQEDFKLLSGNPGGRPEELCDGIGANIIDLPSVRRDTRM